jgi:putative NADPH-quinone reductase
LCVCEFDAYFTVVLVVHVIDLTKKFYLRASQIKIQRNNGAIAAARLRNRQLRAALAALREKERNALGANDLIRMQKRVALLKELHNHLREDVKAKQKLVSAHQTHISQLPLFWFS